MEDGQSQLIAGNKYFFGPGFEIKAGSLFEMTIDVAHWERIAKMAVVPNTKTRFEMTVNMLTHIVKADVIQLLEHCRIGLKITEAKLIYDPRTKRLRQNPGPGRADS
jgi:hypothetical protein